MAVREVEVTAVITITFPANLPANNKVVASIAIDPSYPAVQLLTVPSKESWVIEDLYIPAAAPTPDFIVEFLKNLVRTELRSPIASGMRVDNVARPRIQPFKYDGDDIISIVGQNLAAVGTAAATVTGYAKLRRFTPSS